MKKIMIFIFACIISLFSINNVKAEDYVAKIGETNYATLDEAIKSAEDNDTIILLANATTEGFILNKNLTIDGKNEKGENYSITFNKYGIDLGSYSLTFKNTSVIMEGINSTLQISWATICSSPNANLTLINTVMLMDNKNDMTKHGDTYGQHAIYLTGNNKLTLDNSWLEIKNYNQDALEWDGGDGGYNVILTNSTYTSDNNRSGFTGKFTVKATNSNINVINSKGNGSNGSNFEFINSTVNFLDNNSHGLSAINLTIDNSKVYANGNGANGIHTTGIVNVKNNSTVHIMNNDCSISSKWTIPGALYIAGKAEIDETTDLVISNNNGSGIYVTKNGNLTLSAGIITENDANKLKLGGGINNNGTISISDKVEIYNNNAEIAGDDIYSTSVLELANVVNNKNLKLSTIIRKNTQELNDCEDLINGWYDDSENSRWNAHNENTHTEIVNSGKYEGTLAIKAAHNLEGKVIIHYVDEDGNTLLEDITLTGYENDSYKTTPEDIEGYTLIDTIGKETGKYASKKTIEVTYIYQFTKGQGSTEEPVINPPVEEPPHTSVNTSIYAIVLLVNVLGISVLLKKREN